MTGNESEQDAAYNVTEQWIEDVAFGGALLGGGGGGDLEDGLAFGRVAVNYGRPTVIPLSDLDEAAVVVTVSAVGAPAAVERQVDPSDYVAAFDRIREELAARDEHVVAVMTNEMGGFASVNGLVQSAATGVPVVDAACNGRAHPTGPMGSMGLPPDEYTLQSAVGGDARHGRHVAVTVEAALPQAADLVRSAAEVAGGLVGVARNPVDAAYVVDNAAVGIYEQARTLGQIIRGGEDGLAVADRLAQELGGSVRAVGVVEEVELETRGGFDVGSVTVDGHELTFWNEYMTLENGEDRIATFPDLISTLDVGTGRPITTAQLGEDDRVAVLVAPAEVLRLGGGMTDPALFEPVEKAIDKAIVEHVFPEGPQ